MDCITLGILLQKAFSYKCKKLKNERKYKICQILMKMLKEHAIPNSGLQNLKICLSKGYR